MFRWFLGLLLVVCHVWAQGQGADFFSQTWGLPEQDVQLQLNRSSISQDQALEMPVFNLLSEDQYSNTFARFMSGNRKVYKKDQLASRYRVFKSNMDFVIEYNANVLENSTFQLDYLANPLADETFEEYKKRLGFRPPRYADTLWRPEISLAAPPLGAPTSVDWRTQGAVTAVRDQGSCGSCYSYSAAATVEGAIAIAGGSIQVLSTAQCRDCSSSYGNNKCGGGLMEYCYKYYIAKGGVCSDRTYPYKTTAGSCLDKKCTPVARIKSWGSVAKSESALLTAAARQPLAIAVAASSRAFQMYKTGIFDQATSCGNNLDHAVTLVGYGTENNKDYWIVKNSWGTGWGEKGYIRFARGKNMCGLMNHVVYPTA